jgi:hypothetical protein
MDLRDTTLGMYQTIEHKNHTKDPIQNNKTGFRRALVCQQQNPPRELWHTIRKRRNQPHVSQLPTPASGPPQPRRTPTTNPPPLREGYADDGPQMPYLKPRLDTTNY